MSFFNTLSPAQSTILAAVISAFAAIAICIINNRSQSKRYIKELEAKSAERVNAQKVRDAKLEMWMETVDKKLDIHNGYAEKFGEISTNIAVIKNDIKTLYRKGE